MQFRITIIIGIFFLLISSVSAAKPVSQTETPTQKTEQTRKKKSNFIQKIILKKIKKVKHDKERASSLAKASVWLSAISFPLLFVGVGAITALIGIIIGIIALTKEGINDKTRSSATTGIALGAVVIIVGLMVLWALLLVTSALGE